MFFFVNDRKQDKPWGKEVIKQNENGISCNYLEKGNHGHFFFFFFFFLYVRRIRVDYNFLIFFLGFEIC
jgi:hypothetical protein